MSDLEKARQIIDDTDREMARLFERRMDAARQVAAYKKENGLSIVDAAREEHLVCQNAAYILNEEYLSYYVRFLRATMEISKDFQTQLTESN